ncbi:MAG: hypothetical protein ACK473_12740 [Sphingomonadales bacterium]
MAVDADAGAVDACGEAFGEGRDSSGLVDIVVTATKRETNLQETPIAIAVMSDEDLQKRQASSLLDLGDYANFNAPRTVGMEVTLAF